MPIDIKNDDLQTALKKLKAREDNLKQLEAVSSLGSWEVDLITKKSIWSDRSYEIYGFNRGEITESLDFFFSILIPEDVSRAKKALATAIESKTALQFKCSVQHPDDGHIIHLLINGQVLYSEEGTPLKLIGTTQDITQEVRTQQHSIELSNLLEHSSIEIYIIDAESLQYLYVNKGATDALGYSLNELLTMSITDINPNLKSKKIDLLKEILLTKNHLLTRAKHKRKDGTFYNIQAYVHTLKYQGRQAYALFDTDITQQVALEEQERKQAKILEHIHDAIIATDREGKITSWNQGSSRLLGYSFKEIIGHNIQEIYSSKNSLQLYELFTTLAREHKLDIEAYAITKENKEIICNIFLSAFKDDNGKTNGYVGYIQDITHEKFTQHLLAEQTEKLRHQAHHDALTNLANRTLFQERLSQAIIITKRKRGKFALLFLDLDQFKKINDTLGHDVGDKVLIEVAMRLQNTLREEDTLSRLGGDEFTIILKGIQKVHNPSIIAQKIIDVLQEPIIIAGHKLYITVSIGISIYPDDASIEKNLIKYADSAMYKAKEEGRNNFQFYSSEMTSLAYERVVMESSLRIAIKEEEFIVYFQPQIEALTDKLIGMEALVRWQHPTLGLVSPDKFIPIAEDSGLIVTIDRLVMKAAMKQYVLWYKQGLNPGVLALNLAMKQLAQDDFLEELLKNMHEIDFNPNWLELEVTETQVMNNPELSIEKLHTISEMGIELAIDDFGTGYSSLSYLKKLPLDKLKIDQSFISDIPHNSDDVAITQAIIALGKSLNFKLIAEGVETKEQKEFLIKNKCQFIQGYYYSQPLSAGEMTKLLELTAT